MFENLISTSIKDVRNALDFSLESEILEAFIPQDTESYNDDDDEDEIDEEVVEDEDEDFIDKLLSDEYEEDKE